MAYASTSSPFANVKGPSLFSAAKPSPWASSTASPVPNAAASSAAPLGGTSSLSSLTTEAAGSPPRETSLKRTGFEAFASSSSPFASAAKRPKSPTPSLFGNRSKSPKRHQSPARAINAFSAYASGGAHAFATANTAAATQKRSGSGSPALGEGSGEAGPSALNPLAGRDAETPEEGENEKSVSFGERLRASKDDEDQESEEKKLNYTEQDGASVW